MRRGLVLATVLVAATVWAADKRVLTHPSVEGLSGSEVATLLAPRSDGTTRGVIALVRDRAAGAPWYPPGPVKPGDTLYSEAVVAPGSYNVAVACRGARWSQVFTVDVDAAAGRVYRFSCEVIPIDKNRVAAKVVVSEEGTSDELGALKSRAEKGDAQAQYGLGLIYGEGLGVAQDEAEAVPWYRKAAEQGFAPAQNDLGSMYARGRGVKQDYAEALRWYRKAAEQGEAQAQSSIGAMYMLGQGVERNDVEAVRWLRKAAEQGFAPAQSNLGTMYADGRGVTQDGAEAAHWYSKAAEQGLAEAHYNLGELYELGKALPRDTIEAHFWYALAATVEPAGPLHDEATKSRDRVAAQLTPTQIAAARLRLQAWRDAHPTPKPTAGSAALEQLK
jgi:TPR repeat protein